MKRVLISTAVALAALMLSAGAWAKRYRVEEVPLKRDLSPEVGVSGMAMNNVGNVVVDEFWMKFSFTAEVCRPKRCERMPALPDHGADPWTYADDINDAGQVAGTSTDRQGVRQAVLLQDGVLTQIGPLAIGKGLQSQAFGINSGGEVVGYGEVVAEKGWRGFHWKDGVLTVLPTLGGSFGRAVAINDAGVIVGSAKTANEHEHAFMLKDGTMADLGTLGGKDSVAVAINAQGVVAGYSRPPHADYPMAFVYRDGLMTSLGTLPGQQHSAAWSINDAGDVVGVSANNPTGPTNDRGFIHDAEGMHDLNELLRASDRKLYTVDFAYDINQRGDIAARGTRKDTGAELALVLKRID